MSAAGRVAIVVSSESPSVLTALALQRHVWALRSPDTEAVAQWFWNERPTADTDPLESGMTLFSGEGKAESDLVSILDDVLLHHESHVHPLGEIEVYGADPTATVREAFDSLGFSDFEKSPNGFVAYRRSS